uniref:Predicted nucleic acid-binding protein, contains PIN domain n=1 Tax=Candidatus Kentrum sp. FM TaxID=2126340 RepID=A0A450S331_9GAMM|nr:MAG: Predicted nucleic acid-binding protein, contains PIN domain [Candidatus Kentron sp. FM]VFJ73057.1 MAG: Predicted nucleic acid-binding protein, contains PIN domain [Candidatus Kentron sp. FM]VFK06419.1 MAG: Predicted nucleic acid-binding protein, contains PIN domain [Candidatus Kentron sp. FM]
MSAKPSNKYVLDTSALLAFIEEEEGVEIIDGLLEGASDKKNNIYISTVSAIEVFYISMQEQGRAVAEERLELLEIFPLIQEPLTPDLCRTIGKLKATKPMSFADCCIAGLAKEKNAVLVHKDPEFESVEDEIRQLKLPYNSSIKFFVSC